MSERHETVLQCPAIRPVCVDLTNWENTKKAVESIGPIDLLVNNAAVLNPQPFLDVDEKTFDELVTVIIGIHSNGRLFLSRRCYCIWRVLFMG